MIQIAWSIAGFIVALGILVAIHEYGHFWVARTLGVKVLRYSVGFGSSIWSRVSEKDGTEYAVGAIPLGGYVKMLDENEGEVAEHERHRAFNRQPLWKRSAIVLAGPLANFLFAIVAYWLVFCLGVTGLKPVVGDVAPNSLAAQAGFQVGDEITRIDGRQNRSWAENRLYLFDRALAGGQMPVTVRGEDGETRELSLDFSSLSARDVDGSLLESKIGLRNALPEVPTVIGSVAENTAASSAGIQVGDEVTMIDGEATERWQDLVRLIQPRFGQTTSIQIMRDGALLDLEVTPGVTEHDGKKIGLLGVSPEPITLPDDMFVKVRSNPVSALGQGIEQTWVMSWLTVKMLAKMVTLEVSPKNISGPITIAQYAGQSAQVGIDRFLLFLALVSISLGVLNLLPIPVLDGGHLLYHIIEAIKGGPLSDGMLYRGQQVGILLLAGLMCLAFYNDISRLLFG